MAKKKKPFQFRINTISYFYQSWAFLSRGKTMNFKKILEFQSNFQQYGK
jgi:hypothetical protein